ncbi:hypothetical protein [Actinomadura violacea]|uniref:Recombinase domain-containing protein n=1 Tax=Actinomadura violacea TaxID=2819934 RepID=A0ABS3RMF2_9ACTN|nr:hypothetical protein [Actinomadura violacea]MBO2457270.1 hypothetical protein [Actinomadura violacea]
MTTSTGPYVFGSRGPVNAGPGDQNNTFNSIVLEDANGRSPRQEAADQLRWLWRRFVEPPGFGAAADALRRNGTVFLDGEPGSGRFAAAKMLLWSPEHAGRALHEIVLQEQRGDCLDLDHVGDDDHVWLDLSAADPDVWIKVHGELSGLRSRAWARGARLAVILPHAGTPARRALDLRSDLGRFRVRIGRPGDREVLLRHLRSEGVPVPRPLPPIPYLDAGLSVDRIARYARLIAEAYADARDGEFAVWCRVAYQALAGWRDQVAERIDDLKGGKRRAFLLVTAMLHGAHAEVVHHAAAAFLRTVRAAPAEDPALEDATLHRRLHEIHATLDDSGHVRFVDLDYDAAVRAHFWTHMPGLQQYLWEWVAETVPQPGLSGIERSDLVDRFAELCLNDRHREALMNLLETWTATPPSKPRIEAAARILQRGLRDRRHGRFFRRKIYDWAQRSGLPECLATVLVVACRDEMAVGHPDEAIVRLHHMARREQGTRARDALAGLVRDDPRLLRRMLDRLAMPSTDEQRRVSDARIFLALADPALLIDPGACSRPLLAEAAVQERLADGWSRALGCLTEGEWAPSARDWLRNAAADERCRDLLLDLLLAGCAHRPRVLARMYTLAREAAPRTDLEDLVLRKIRTGRRAESA